MTTTTAVPTTTAPPPTATVPPAVHETLPPVVDDTEPPNVRVTLSSRYVSPNGDGRLDQVTIRVTVDEPVTLTVRLLKVGGVGRADLVGATAVPAGTPTFRWNGHLRRPNGRWGRSGDGPVTVQVLATDAMSNTTTTSRRVIVDTRAPSVRLRAVGPEPWSGSGLLTDRFVARDAARPLTMWAQVVRGRRLVAETSHRRRPADTRSLSWRPLHRRRPLFAGAYETRVVVRDAAGNIGRSAPRPFRVHRPVTTSVIHSIGGAGRRVALTIDDCADGPVWRRMLDTLQRMRAGATFFCNGNNVRRFADVARRAATQDRISLGSHSSDHTDLATVSAGDAYWRLVSDEAAWWSVARTTPVPYFRPPYGSTSRSVLYAAGMASFPYTVMWSVDTRDWETPVAGAITRKAVDQAKPGSIILIHVKPATADALPAIITGLRARGLEPSGLSEMLPH